MHYTSEMNALHFGVKVKVKVTVLVAALLGFVNMIS